MAQVPQEDPSLPYVPTVKAQDSLFAPIYSIPTPPRTPHSPFKMLSHFCTDERWSWLMLNSLPSAVLTSAQALLILGTRSLKNAFQIPIPSLSSLCCHFSRFIQHRFYSNTHYFELQRTAKALDVSIPWKSNCLQVRDVLWISCFFISNGILVMNKYTTYDFIIFYDFII